MENIKISTVCGLCGGCLRAINTTKEELNKGNSVTIFKEIVHNKNVNNSLAMLGAKTEDDITKLSPDNIAIIRAHGEPPQTFEYLRDKGIEYRDCTCPNVSAIHNKVQEYSNLGYKIILLGKHKTKMHPEVLGTVGWCNTDCVLVEDEEDISKLQSYHNDKFYLVCQTTFNMQKADLYIDKINEILTQNNCEIVVNKSICSAQKLINQHSVELAKQSDIMIVVGGKNSSNSIELYKNMSSICPSIFIENIFDYTLALKEAGLNISKSTKIGLTAGASTLKEELVELKDLIEKDIQKA